VRGDDGGDKGWFSNPGARSFRLAGAEGAGDARRFHESVPGYAMTALTELPELARRWGVGHVFVKDESTRFGLPAFKALGASWAIARLVTERAGGTERPAYDDALAAARTLPISLVSATDGNHGRAVAHFAHRLGLPSVVVIPTFVTVAAERAIAREGAEVRRVGSTYDEAVAAAAAYVEEDADRVLVQDMAWPGYQHVPAWVVQGYRTMTAEIAHQLAERGVGAPGLVAVPVGVGSLAEAVVASYRSGTADRSPAVLSCEPETAACLLASLRAGRSVTVGTSETVMAGLNCGTVSASAWPVLHGGLDAAVTVSDADALHAVRVLRELGVSAGASGAASLAGVEAALGGPQSPRRRAALSVDEGTVVVLLNTEGSDGAGGLTLDER
jgi:diaminopropionate ammonia-lyase